MFLLACFARVDPGKTVLKQVSVDRFDGLPDFKGLGQLSGAQLATLYPLAEPLTAHELTLAARVWPAYADSDIDGLTRLLAADFSRLRYSAGGPGGAPGPAVGGAIGPAPAGAAIA